MCIMFKLKADHNKKREDGIKERCKYEKRNLKQIQKESAASFSVTVFRDEFPFSFQYT